MHIILSTSQLTEKNKNHKAISYRQYITKSTLYWLNRTTFYNYKLRWTISIKINIKTNFYLNDSDIMHVYTYLNY